MAMISVIPLRGIFGPPRDAVIEASVAWGVVQQIVDTVQLRTAFIGDNVADIILTDARERMREGL